MNRENAMRILKSKLYQRELDKRMKIRPEGKIVYEYNPLRNYRLTRDTDSNGLHHGESMKDNEGNKIQFNPKDPKLIALLRKGGSNARPMKPACIGKNGFPIDHIWL